MEYTSRKQLIPLFLTICLIGLSLVLAACSSAPITSAQHESINPDAQDDSGKSPDQASVSDKPVEIATNRTDSSAEQQQEIIMNAIADGTYSDVVTYAYHSGSENVRINVTVENDVILSASVESEGKANPTSARFIKGVNAALPELVVGKKITELNLPKQISGSSLTSAAFRNHLTDLVETY